MSEMTPQELATYGTEYLSQVLQTEHDRFVEAENKTERYGQVLALIIGAAVIGGIEFRNALAQEWTFWVLLFVGSFILAGIAAVVGIGSIAAAVRVENTPGMPADKGTLSAFSNHTQGVQVIQDINARYAESIASLRNVNDRRYGHVQRAFRFTYATMVLALAGVVGYAGMNHQPPQSETANISTRSAGDKPVSNQNSSSNTGSQTPQTPASPAPAPSTTVGPVVTQQRGAGQTGETKAR